MNLLLCRGVGYDVIFELKSDRLLIVLFSLFKLVVASMPGLAVTVVVGGTRCGCYNRNSGSGRVLPLVRFVTARRFWVMVLALGVEIALRFH